MTSLRPAKVSDFSNISVSEAHDLKTASRRAMHKLLGQGAPMALADGEHVLGLADVVPYADGYYVWIMLSNDIGMHITTALKHALRTFHMYEKDTVYAHIEVGNDKAKFLAERVGMKPHALGHTIYNGIEYDLYKREP